MACVVKRFCCRHQWQRAVDTSDTNRSALDEEAWIALSAADYTVPAKAALMLVSVALPQDLQPKAASASPKPGKPLKP